MFVKEVLEQENKTVVITAPCGFGKTTNLKILKAFLEIEVDKEGNRKTRVHPCKAPIVDTNNYQSFTKESYKITECKNLMLNYFGKFPVVTIELECFSAINNLQDAIKFYKRAVHSSFKDHEYLSRSEKLSHNERKLVSFWSDDHNYLKMSRRQVVTGLRELARLLCRHFDNRVWVLVDDYDAVVQAAITEAEDTEALARVLRYTSRLLTHVFNNNSDCVRGGVLTGVVPISMFNASDGVQYEMYNFLGDHKFEGFYGLSREEFETVCAKIQGKNNFTFMSEAEHILGCYQSEGGMKMYKLRPAFRFLQGGRTASHVFNSVSNLNSGLEMPLIRTTVEKLLKGEVFPFNQTKAFIERDLIELRSLFLKPESNVTLSTNLFLSYLLKEGYLTYCTSTNQMTNGLRNMSLVKVLNIEAAADLKKQFKLTD